VKSPSICTYTTLKAPRQEIVTFVNYHLDIGVDHLFLFFDDPTDESASIFNHDKRVTCIRCDGEHWQSLGIASSNIMTIPEKQTENSKIAIELAGKQKYDWIIHIDIDEFLYSFVNLKAELSSVCHSIDTVSYRPLEAIANIPTLLNYTGFKYSYTCKFSTKMFVYTSTDKSYILLSKILYILKREFCRLIGLAKPFKYRLTKAHIEGKCATRLKSKISKLGPHFPYPSTNSKLHIKISRNSWVLHYDSPTYALWRRKWNRRMPKAGNPIWGHKSRSHTNRMFLDYSEYSEKNDEKEFKRFYNFLYGISPFEYKVLKALGLIKEIPSQHTPDFIL
jgi:hypothetical protein